MRIEPPAPATVAPGSPVNGTDNHDPVRSRGCRDPPHGPSGRIHRIPRQPVAFRGPRHHRPECRGRGGPARAPPVDPTCQSTSSFFRATALSVGGIAIGAATDGRITTWRRVPTRGMTPGVQRLHPGYGPRGR